MRRGQWTGKISRSAGSGRDGGMGAGAEKVQGRSGSGQRGT